MFRRVRYKIRTHPTLGWAAFLAVLLLWLAWEFIVPPSVEDGRAREAHLRRTRRERAERRAYARRLDIRRNASAYARSTPPGETCFLADRLEGDGMPTVHSAFADPVSRQVVFVGVRFLRETWASERFACAFEGGEVTASDPVVADYRSFGYLAQYVFVLTCPMPAGYRHRRNFTVSLHKETWRRQWYRYAYANLTVCRGWDRPGRRGGGDSGRRFLSICTMVKNADEFLPDWLDYHRYLGVEHAYVYDNAPEELSQLRQTVREFVEDGFVTVVPWSHRHSAEKTYLEVQIAHENDCLWRHRHDTEWMLKIDVDEYVQPMDPSRPGIPDYLREPELEGLGALRLRNWFFGRPNLSERPPGSIVERNRWRAEEPTPENTGRDKNILRPVNVHYFKIHAVKLGGETVSLDPRTALRLVHYRGDNPRVRYFDLPDFSVRDESMVRIWEKVTEAKERRVGGP